jgi:3'-phosphoadenosine 5'-phosphosulfate (PAPS) 3'-phosphatase
MFHILKKSNDLFKKLHNNEIKLEKFAKGPDDYFTTADYIIQKMFENNLEKFYPRMKIIGEEDTTKETIKESEYYKVDLENEINFNFLDKNFKENNNTKDFNMEDLAFFIDPIDSTTNFIKKKYAPVTVMIGLTRNEIPFFGILHYFCWEGNEQISKTIFNYPGEGVYEVNLDELSAEIKTMSFKKQENIVNIMTSSSIEKKTEKCKQNFLYNIILYYIILYYFILHIYIFFLYIFIEKAMNFLIMQKL